MPARKGPAPPQLCPGVTNCSVSCTAKAAYSRGLTKCFHDLLEDVDVASAVFTDHSPPSSTHVPRSVRSAQAPLRCSLSSSCRRLAPSSGLCRLDELGTVGGGEEGVARGRRTGADGLTSPRASSTRGTLSVEKSRGKCASTVGPRQPNCGCSALPGASSPLSSTTVRTRSSLLRSAILMSATIP